MENYKFLLKPILFIFNLLFATWLVLQIEKVSPSDFGRHKAIFDTQPVVAPVLTYDKYFIKQIAIDYKAGRIDSLTFDRLLNEHLGMVDKNRSEK
ncbi:MAG: hypothetical protein M3R27_05245 [Bacteroidota bacterium]|nr:hypothetical protein [Bacteroidota bacterium]